MLAAMEDLLDTWGGTLIVVSHDRYLLERVTDQQYAILGGHLRHLPGGVDEYLHLRSKQEASGGLVAAASGGADGSVASGKNDGGDSPKLSGAQLRAATKETGAVERRLEKVNARIEGLHAEFAAFDQSDFQGLAALQEKLNAALAEAEELEMRWLELAEQIEG